MDSETENVNKERNNVNDGWEFSTFDIIFTSIFTLCFIGQFILLFFFNKGLDILLLEIIGYILWGLSGIFGVLPMLIFKRKGNVPEGKSYINTKKLVKDGLYAIVRHPQYAAGMLLSISITLLVQTWISVIFSVIIIVLTYQWTYREDKELIEKFGEDYRKYKEEIPRLNFLYGALKYLLRRKKELE
ncbi:MAG: conserved membrane protein of unknown function [Promethearchaeota archaeon]|nr:MAG: conserved membrane protein of unknown function [Candidatus Lokiarchaeota archaeon]